MSTKFLSPGWRMPRNANQSKQSNYSMNFNGVANEYIVSSLDGTGGSSSSFGSGSDLNLTISFWFKLSQLTSTFGMLSWATSPAAGGGLLLFVQQTGNGTVQVYIVANGAGYRYVSSTLTVDTWYNLTFTRTAADNTWRFYLNSVLDSTTYVDNGSVSGQSSATNFYIGSGYGGSGNFNGQINQVSIFDYALSPGQVTTLWGGGTSVSNPMALPSPPIAYYPLGTSAWDGNFLAENNAIGDYVFDFDGSNGQQIGISNTSLINGYTAATFSFWFKGKSGLASFDGLLCQSSTASRYTKIHVDSATGSTNYRMYIQQNAGGVYTSAYTADNLDLNKWFHVCVKGTVGGKWTIYIDGSDATIGQGSNNIAAIYQDGAEFKIGRDSGTAVGELSNVQIFNTELPATEVTTLYNYGSPIQTLASIPQNSNLKAWYKLDASEVYNSSTTEWSIDNNQNPSPKSSLSFNNGSTRVVFDSNSLNITSALTVSGWFRIPTSNTGGGGTNIQFFLNEDGTGGTQRNWSTAWRGTGYNYVWFAVFHNDGTSSVVNSGNNFTPNDGKWHHYFGTWDGTTNTNSMKLYIDNILVGQDTPLQTGIRATSSVGTTLGAVAESYSWNFEGELSNWAVWNSSQLSELPNIYNQGVPAATYTNTPLGWWKLNNKTSGINDLGSGGNNGVIGTSGTGVVSKNAGFVSKTAGESSGMTQANLVQSDLQTVAPYSKYAMNFDGTDYIDCGTALGDSLGTYTGDLTLSYWFNTDSLTDNRGLFYIGSFSNTQGEFQVNIYSNSMRFRVDGGTPTKLLDISGLNTGTWYHIGFVYKAGDITNSKVYLNGAEQLTTNTGTFPSSLSFSGLKTIIGGYYGTGNTLDGKLSNFSIWNTDLTSAQVTEIYNEGLPSDLNSHSAYSNLVSWWQLGENSSFASNWICADEKGTNNGTSTGMPVGALTNGVGTTANGISSGMSEGNLVGDAPYSTANAVSSGMSVASRVTGSGNTP